MAQSSDLRPDGIGLVSSPVLDGAKPSASSAVAAVPAYEPGPWPFYVPRVRTFEALRFRDFRLLWLGQGGTSMGQWMDQMARGFLIYQMTGSALELGYVSAMRAVPMLLFSVVAGVIADRYGRKAQLVISQVVNVIINLVLAMLVITHQIQVWHIYVTAFMAGTVMAFQQPARQSLISDLVGRRHLPNAVALNSAIFNLMRSIGPAVAGFTIVASAAGLAYLGVNEYYVNEAGETIVLAGLGGSYLIQAALYAWATVWTIQMRVPGELAWMDMIRLKRIYVLPTESDGGEQMGMGSVGDGRAGRRANDSFFGSMVEGFGYLLQNRMIFWLMFLGLAPVLLGMPFATLVPVFAVDVFHGANGGAVEQSWMLSMVGVGSLFGALGIASIGSFHRKGMLMLGGATMFGIGLIGFSQSTWLPLSLACLFVVGVSNASYTSQDQTIIQSLAPSNVRGRVMSIYMLNRGLMPLGALLAGFLAHQLGGPWAVAIMGASCAAVAIFVAFKKSEIRDIEI